MYLNMIKKSELGQVTFVRDYIEFNFEGEEILLEKQGKLKSKLGVN